MNIKKHFVSSFLFLLILSTNTIFAQTTIPNSGFESWINGNPEFWDTSNKNILGTIFNGVRQDTISPQQGNSAAMVATTIKVVGTFPVTLPGMLTLGEIKIDYINQSGTVTAGIPFSGRPDELKGYYKYNPTAGDSCFIGIMITKWDGSQNDTIAEAEFFKSSKVQSWTEFIIPIDYSTTDTPDSMNIFAASSDITNLLAVLGSTLWLDNLSLDYGGVSVIDLALNENFSVYPDESRENLIISLNFAEECKTSISLYTVDGKLLYHITKNIHNSNENINIASLPAGIYLVDVRTTNGKRYTQKVGIN